MMKLKVTLFGLLTAVSLGIVSPYASAQDPNEGFHAYEKGHYAAALQIWRSLAEQGYSTAQLLVGMMYSNGEGVPQNYQEAAKWFRLSAEQGNAFAQDELGVMYSGGLGVPRDSREAAKWYRLSAEQGHARAQAKLGMVYALGEGVPQDYIRAHMWLNLAVANGSDYGRESRNLTAARMTLSQIEKAQALATECLRKGYKGC